jgi:hypothetical protein
VRAAAWAPTVSGSPEGNTAACDNNAGKLRPCGVVDPTQLRFTALLHHVTIDLKVLNSIWGEDFLSISYVRNMTH